MSEQYVRPKTWTRLHGTDYDVHVDTDRNARIEVEQSCEKGTGALIVKFTITQNSSSGTVIPSVSFRTGHT